MKPSPLKYVPGEPSPYTLRIVRAIGHGCLISLILLCLSLAVLYEDPYTKTFGLIAAHFGGGRVASTAVGIKLGFPPWFIFVETALQDIIFVCYLFPLLVSGFQQLTRLPGVGGFLLRSHELALEHKKRIAPFGVFGLFAFVFFPAHSTGPVVGVMLGYLLGMGAALNLAAVAAGNSAGILAWIWFYDKLAEYNTSLAYAVIAVFFAIVGAGALYGWWRKRRPVPAEAGE